MTPPMSSPASLPHRWRSGRRATPVLVSQTLVDLRRGALRRKRRMVHTGDLWISTNHAARSTYDRHVTQSAFSIVDGFVPAEGVAPDNLRDEVWSYALDQRAFGPRKVLVALTDEQGFLRGLAYTDRTDPPEVGFEACLAYLGVGADAAIAFCDQPVADGPTPPDFADLFARARHIAAGYGIHLVDWIACDDDRMRSNRTPLERDQLDDEWWDVPRR